MQSLSPIIDIRNVNWNFFFPGFPFIVSGKKQARPKRECSHFIFLFLDRYLRWQDRGTVSISTIVLCFSWQVGISSSSVAHSIVIVSIKSPVDGRVFFIYRAPFAILRWEDSDNWEKFIINKSVSYSLNMKITEVGDAVWNLALLFFSYTLVSSYVRWFTRWVPLNIPLPIIPGCVCRCFGAIPHLLWEQY